MTESFDMTALAQSILKEDNDPTKTKSRYFDFVALSQSMLRDDDATAATAATPNRPITKNNEASTPLTASTTSSMMQSFLSTTQDDQESPLPPKKRATPTRLDSRLPWMESEASNETKSSIFVTPKLSPPPKLSTMKRRRRRSLRVSLDSVLAYRPTISSEAKHCHEEKNLHPHYVAPSSITRQTHQSGPSNNHYSSPTRAWDSRLSTPPPGKSPCPYFTEWDSVHTNYGKYLVYESKVHCKRHFNKHNKK